MEVEISPHYGNHVPIILFFAILLFALYAAIVLAPLGLVQRYRAGTKRRRARWWMAGINVTGLSFSVALFIGGASITSRWVPNALIYSLVGLTLGCLLGLVGLGLTRWEEVTGALHYTPNRSLVLTITLVVAGRLAYGVWRLCQTWSLRGQEGAWLEHSGISGSLGASALILGYSLAYWLGMLWKIQRTS